MKLQRLLSLTRQAIDDYQMIQTGDHIMLGISGGKDSLTLLYALSSLKNFIPINLNYQRLQWIWDSRDSTSLLSKPSVRL